MYHLHVQTRHPFLYTCDVAANMSGGQGSFGQLQLSHDGFGMDSYVSKHAFVSFTYYIVQCILLESKVEKSAAHEMAFGFMEKSMLNVL